MIYIIWEFYVNPTEVSEFENNYGSNGTWAALFKKSKDYYETIFLKDKNIEHRYLTIDKWKNLAAFENFKLDNLEDYNTLDAKCEKLTLAENKIGILEE